MTQFSFFVGVDIASASFMACVGSTPWKIVLKPMKFENHEEGFTSFLGWLKDNRLPSEQTVVCMEATGVYGEGLAYFLSASGYSVPWSRRSTSNASFRSMLPRRMNWTASTSLNMPVAMLINSHSGSPEPRFWRKSRCF